MAPPASPPPPSTATIVAMGAVVRSVEQQQQQHVGDQPRPPRREAARSPFEAPSLLSISDLSRVSRRRHDVRDIDGFVAEVVDSAAAAVDGNPPVVAADAAAAAAINAASPRKFTSLPSFSLISRSAEEKEEAKAKQAAQFSAEASIRVDG